MRTRLGVGGMGGIELTDMKTAIALPLVTGFSYMSAYTPPITEIGLLALTPASSLNINSAAQFGDRAQAIVKIV